MHESSTPTRREMTRREFCRRAIKRTGIAAGAGAATLLAYQKPTVKSFFGTSQAYAANTPGKFTLDGITD